MPKYHRRAAICRWYSLVISSACIFFSFFHSLLFYCCCCCCSCCNSMNYWSHFSQSSNVLFSSTATGFLMRNTCERLHINSFRHLRWLCECLQTMRHLPIYHLVVLRENRIHIFIKPHHNRLRVTAVGGATLMIIHIINYFVGLVSNEYTPVPVRYHFIFIISFIIIRMVAVHCCPHNHVIVQIEMFRVCVFVGGDCDDDAC